MPIVSLWIVFNMSMYIFPSFNAQSFILHHTKRMSPQRIWRELREDRHCCTSYPWKTRRRSARPGHSKPLFVHVHIEEQEPDYSEHRFPLSASVVSWATCSILHLSRQPCSSMNLHISIKAQCMRNIWISGVLYTHMTNTLRRQLHCELCFTCRN